MILQFPVEEISGVCLASDYSSDRISLPVKKTNDCKRFYKVIWAMLLSVDTFCMFPSAQWYSVAPDMKLIHLEVHYLD